jgi:hypothetical protein
VSSILWVTLTAALEVAAAQGCNLPRVDASGAEMGELVLRQPVVEIVADWEPRSCLQVGIVGIVVLQVEVAWDVAHAAGMAALAAGKWSGTALGICFVNSAGRAAAVSSGSLLQYGLAGCNNNRPGCLLLPPSMRAPLPALYLPQLRG